MTVLDVAGLPSRHWNRCGERPVLALHCSLAHAGAWSGLAEALHGVTMTALDAPGHGRQPDWDGVSDLHGQATREAVALAESLGGGEAIDFIGHSFGGTVALRIALERPELLRSLTLCEPVIFAAARDAGHPAFAAFQAKHLEMARLVMAGEMGQATAFFHGIWGNGVAFADLPERAQHYMEARIGQIVAMNPVLLGDTAGLLRYMGLEAVGVPVLLIEGAESPAVIDAVHSELARRLPQVQRLSVPGAGHMVPISHAVEIAPMVQAHLERC